MLDRGRTQNVEHPDAFLYYELYISCPPAPIRTYTTLTAGVHGADLAANEALTSRLSIIAGTSTCHMALSSKPLFIKGVWGPYEGAIVPGYCLTEGGESATGALVWRAQHAGAIAHIAFTQSFTFRFLLAAPCSPFGRDAALRARRVS